MIQFTHSDRYFYLDDGGYRIIGNTDGSKIYLYRKMREWFIENNIPYELLWAHRDNGDFSAAIKFNNEEDAMAFKLRWM